MRIGAFLLSIAMPSDILDDDMNLASALPLGGVASNPKDRKLPRSRRVVKTVLKKPAQKPSRKKPAKRPAAAAVRQKGGRKNEKSKAKRVDSGSSIRSIPSRVAKAFEFMGAFVETAYSMRESPPVPEDS